MNGLTALHPRAYHGRRTRRAGVAQLVEYELPKLGVAGSNPVARSIIRDAPEPERLCCSASRAGFTPPGVAKRPRSVSGGEFTSPPRKTRAGGLGGAPLAPPSSMSVFLLPALRPLVSRGGRRGRPRFGRPRRTRLGVLRAWRGFRPAASGAFARLP